MYHYVRRCSTDFPFLRFLDFEDFKKQLDVFQAEYHFPSRAEVESFFASGDAGVLCATKPNMVLTFDDGLLDHYQFVLPELRRRGLWGIFYINTQPIEEFRMIETHVVQALLGRYGGQGVLDRLRPLLSEAALNPDYVEQFKGKVYQPSKQTNDEATTECKTLINYFLKPEARTELLEKLMDEMFPEGGSGLCKAWYMNCDQLVAMQHAGMWLGSHTISHRPMSLLSPEAQQSQIADSFAVLERIVGTANPRTFCFPYGGAASYTSDSLRLLNENDCLMSLDVEDGDIDLETASARRQNLPRFDCNAFPHGKAYPLNPESVSCPVPETGCRAIIEALLSAPTFRYSTITVFTGQHPRHLSLVQKLATIADTVYVVHEVAGSLLPNPKHGEAFQDYFGRVRAAEKKYFGIPAFSPPNVRHLSMLSGDASGLPLDSVYGECLSAEVFVVFGASFLKRDIGNLLEERRAINCHMGVSPFYRGAATTFWALWDQHPQYVGATLHHLTQKLDGGDIICHALPTVENADDGFEFTMKAVKVCHDVLLRLLVNGDVWRWLWEKQDKELQIKSCKKSLFTDEVAAEWLVKCPNAAEIAACLQAPENSPKGMVRPQYM